MTRAQMAAAHPTYVLPSEVTDDGWYRGPGKESDDECRARAKRVLERVRATASGLKDSRNVLVVAHYDFISAFLDAVLVPETTGEFARWRHHNTAVTVLDIEQATGEVAFMKVNAAPHVYEADEGGSRVSPVVNIDGTASSLIQVMRFFFARVTSLWPGESRHQTSPRSRPSRGCCRSASSRSRSAAAATPGAGGPWRVTAAAAGASLAFQIPAAQTSRSARGGGCRGRANRRASKGAGSSNEPPTHCRRRKMT